MTRAIWLVLLAGLIFVNVGCQTTCQRPWCGCSNPAPPMAKPVYVPPPPPSPYLQPQPIQQSGGFPIVPQGAVMTPPPGANIIQPAQAPSMTPPSTSKSQTPWQPIEGLEPPLQQEPKADTKPRIQLYAPEPIDKDNPGPAKEPPSDKKPSVQRSLPAIPQFADAKPNVYAGLNPPLDGLDWLQTEGVKTVVQIRLPGVDDSADRKQVEKRNMRYVAFEIAPAAVTKEKADEFVKLIREGSQNGIFVYDADGSLAGSMWYLYMRQGEVLDAEPSQLRARSLGLQINREGQSREMWLAVKELLNENGR